MKAIILKLNVIGNFFANFIDEIIKIYDVVGLSLTETIAGKQSHLQSIMPVLNVYKTFLTN